MMRFRRRSRWDGPHRQVHYSRITPRRLKFIAEFLRNGGRGRDAALFAGYAASSAGVVSCKLLQDDRVLALIAAEITRRAPFCAEARRRLLLPSRKKHLRLRFEMLLAGGGVPKIIGTTAKPALITDADGEAMRDHVAKFADVFDSTPSGAGSRCQNDSAPKKTAQTRDVGDVRNRSCDAVHVRKRNSDA